VVPETVDKALRKIIEIEIAIIKKIDIETEIEIVENNRKESIIDIDKIIEIDPALPLTILDKYRRIQAIAILSWRY
jgi:hypothetical protein